MSNWITMKRTVQEMVHRYGASDDDIIARAICEAIRHYNTTRFFFNHGSYDFSTVAGTASYGQETSAGQGDGYPSDMLKIIKFGITETNTYYDLQPVSWDQYRELYSSTSYRGYPSRYSWFGKEIHLDPTPNDVYTATIDYIKDIGTPVPSWNGSAWSYSVGGSAVSDAYTNDWFTEGVDLIAARSLYYISTQFLQNAEVAAYARAQEREVLNDLMQSSNVSDVTPHPRPWY